MRQDELRERAIALIGTECRVEWTSEYGRGTKNALVGYLSEVRGDFLYFPHGYPGMARVPLKHITKLEPLSRYAKCAMEEAEEKERAGHEVTIHIEDLKELAGATDDNYYCIGNIIPECPEEPYSCKFTDICTLIQTQLARKENQ